jgi:hypothetical protein
MTMTLKFKVLAITPDNAGLVTDIKNGDGTPFLYYPRFNKASEALIGKTFTVTFASEMVRTAENFAQ